MPISANIRPAATSISRIRSISPAGATLIIRPSNSSPALAASEIPALRSAEQPGCRIGVHNRSVLEVPVPTVLIADDEIDHRELLKLALHRLGFDVVTACDSRTA